MPAIKFAFTDIPPSLNSSKTFVNGKFISSKKYKSWQRFSNIELNLQRGKLPELCYWKSVILIPGCYHGDLDNLVKPLHDLLVKAGRVPDDRYCVDLRICFYAGDKTIVAVQQQGIQKWAKIKKISKSLLSKLVKHSTYRLANWLRQFVTLY